MYCSYYGFILMVILLIGDLCCWVNDMVDFGVVCFFGLYLYCLLFYVEILEQEVEWVLVYLEQMIQFEGLQMIVVIIIEMVVGINGVFVLLFGYLQGVCELCDCYGIVYIVDEVMVGFGWFGEWFGIDVFDVCFDFIIFVKGVNFGYVLFGGVVIFDCIVSVFDMMLFVGGFIYFGYLLVCVVGVVMFEVFCCDGILECVCDFGVCIVEFMVCGWVEKYLSVGDVCGFGLFWVVEFVCDQEICEFLVLFNVVGVDVVLMGVFVVVVKMVGVWLFMYFNCMYIVLLLVISEDELVCGFGVFDDVLSVVDEVVVC